MDTYLTNGLKELRNDKILIDKIKKDFKNAMDLAYFIFDRYAFRKRQNMKEQARKPISKTLFEIISLHFSKLNEIQKEKIK